ncbi:hypothetical protein B5X24_HaOG216409 [Helicoverpa armigera]|nr:hypothetical protein B5X24_HaOG216409 [Helicoverpa armigera]
MIRCSDIKCSCYSLNSHTKVLTRAATVPLSAKQKEAIKAQMAKENAIRQRLSALNLRVVIAVRLLEAVQKGSATALCRGARRIVPAVLGALRSPLAAPRLADAYGRLRFALLPNHLALGDILARLTLRLHKPQCDLEPSWSDAELGAATARTINLMHALTTAKPAAEDEEEPTHKPNHFTAPGFCYAFPLLKLGLSGPALRGDEQTMLNGLAVISQHAALRLDADMMHPALFPIDHMFRLLIDLISSTSGRVLSACTVALLDTAHCAARATLSLDDVTCLLAGLQNPLEVVRDAALRALLCVVECLPPLLEDPEYALTLTKRLLIATFDISEDNKKLAEELWNQLPLAQQWSREPELVELLLEEAQHPSEPVQRAAAAALAHLVERSADPNAAEHVLQRLQDIYTEKLPETLSSQLPVFENFLDKAPKSGGYDGTRQCVVLLVGSLARHLAPGDARIKPITLRLVAALSTPSQQVQEAVSNCLPHLVSSPALEDEIPTIMNKLMKQLLTAEKYGDRKGAAYGIAGIIKGLGILSLKQLDVMGKLTEAIQEKKNFKYREGALFGFEMLCYKLGRLFEPYIVHVLPHLLLCFGDTSQYVRAAADDTAKLIMSKLSAHGVKLVLPSLLQALQDDNWRTKAGMYAP